MVALLLALEDARPGLSAGRAETRGLATPGRHVAPSVFLVTAVLTSLRLCFEFL